MATRRFCDLCDEPIKPDDDKPFVRCFTPPRQGAEKVIGHVMIMNLQNHVLTDVCNECKLRVVTDGDDYDPASAPVATLQPNFVKPVPVPTPIPVLPFTPSIPPAPASRGEEL